MRGDRILKMILPGLMIAVFGANCRGQEVYADPIKLSISGMAEESMPLYIDGGLYFVRSFYKGNTGGEKAGQDIWFSKRLGNNAWSEPKNDFPLFNDFHNNAVIGASKNGDVIYLMRSNHLSTEKSLRLEASFKTEGGWSIPKKMIVPGLDPDGVFHGFYMHPSEKALLISMKGKNSLGEEDLYVCLLDHLGRWSAPIHLGPTVNTTKFEISPFLSSDGSRLYFTSNGRPECKDADIFYSDRIGNSWQEWTEPVKLEGVNSDYFDAYFSLNDQGEAFFVSARDGLSDIYQSFLITAPPAESPATASSAPTFASAEDAIQSIYKSKGTAVVYFDFASAELKSEMRSMLRYIAMRLKNKNYLIELNGYADDLGSTEFNAKLSEKRALAVKEFLVGEGLAPSNIYPSGLGELQAKEGDPEEARARNRRVELSIME